MGLEWKTKRFNELSVNELYDLLQLRSEVFVVEQNCVYQDVDFKDQKALHLLGVFDGKLIAYARLFNAKDYFENASIGRVVVNSSFRNKSFGNDLIQKAIQAIQINFGQTKVTISAQLYLKKFYEFHGFNCIGEVYLEDNIEHIKMEKQ